MTDQQQWQTACREAVYNWLVAGMKEWVGDRSRGLPERTFNIENWVAMLESEAPDVFIAMMKHAEKYLPVEVGDGRDVNHHS